MDFTEIDQEIWKKCRNSLLPIHTICHWANLYETNAFLTIFFQRTPKPNFMKIADAGSQADRYGIQPKRSFEFVNNA